MYFFKTKSNPGVSIHYKQQKKKGKRARPKIKEDNDMMKLGKMVMVAATAIVLGFMSKGMTVEAAEENPDRFQERTVYVSSDAELEAALIEAYEDQAPAINIYRTDGYYGYIAPHGTGCLDNIRDYGNGNVYGTKTSWGNGYTRIEFIYYTTPAEELYLDAIADQIAILTEGYTDYQKVRFVHDYICNMVTYDHATADRLVPKELEKRSAYDGLAEGSTVCSGYALLFQRFMERLDIPCKYYTGYIRGGAHAWNIVYLDGLWYHIDCTWADQSWGISYSYFLIGTDRMGYPENGYAMAPSRYPY